MKQAMERRKLSVGTLSESLEDYLEIIYNLIQTKGEARVKDIAAQKGVSMSSVTPALKRLAAENLIEYNSRKSLKLTKLGGELARRVIGRHEFVKHFMVSLLKVPEEIAERDACLFEHYMSPETFRRLATFFEFIDTCGLNIRKYFEDYCANIQETPTADVCPAPDCPFRHSSFRHRYRRHGIKTLFSLKPGEKGRVARIQAPDNIRQRLIDMGVLPNVEITMERAAPLGDPIEIKLRGYHLSLRKKEAESIILYPSENGDRK